jgi:hypothetical protein
MVLLYQDTSVKRWLQDLRVYKLFCGTAPAIKHNVIVSLEIEEYLLRIASSRNLTICQPLPHEISYHAFKKCYRLLTA